MGWGFFRGGSKRPPRMLKFFSWGKVGSQRGSIGGKSGFQRGGPLGGLGVQSL